MNTTIKQIQCLAAGLLLTAAMTSCVYDRNDDAGTPQEGGALVLNLQTGCVGQTTRTVTDITGDAGNTTATADEQKIQNISIGIFQGTSTTLVGDVKQVAPADPAAATVQDYTQEFASGATTFADGDSILVAVNMPTPGTLSLIHI